MNEPNSIQSYLGKSITFLNPQEDQIDIEDIAHALSLLCRFGGHCREFYSVAQHSVHASENVEKGFELEALLHDATEAYIVDMPRPIKQALQGYRDIESGLDKVIRQKFNLPDKMSKAVHFVDNQMLATEKRDLMKESIDYVWAPLPEPLNPKINPWTPQESRDKFIERFNNLNLLKAA